MLAETLGINLTSANDSGWQQLAMATNFNNQNHTLPAG